MLADQVEKNTKIARQEPKAVTAVIATGLAANQTSASKTVDVCKERRDQGYRRFNESGGDKRCIKEVATPRPRRENPWFFDIPNDKGVKKRFWFNLNT
jgi:hypothetical protein